MGKLYFQTTSLERKVLEFSPAQVADMSFCLTELGYCVADFNFQWERLQWEENIIC